jgi:membrane-associated phospholipid phosphatase
VTTQGTQRGTARTRIAIIAVTCLLLFACTDPAGKTTHKDDAVTEWTLLGDYFGKGSANWRTLAIMHRAMHDALNAAQPVYARWSPPDADEPPANGASPPVAMAAAAHQVLLLLHPDQRIENDQSFRDVLARSPDGPAKDAGVRLGTAIGIAAVRHRATDGADKVRPFVGVDRPGHWRPTPDSFQTSNTGDVVPFLFPSVADVAFVPPPVLGSPLYRTQLDETLRVGAARTTARTKDQTDAAVFWASQSSQRGFLNLAVQLLATHPRPGGLHEHARIMSQLTAALADSAILIWTEKERYYFWRPITAIRSAGINRDWIPLVETPPFPEYPSGHASDCFTGAGVLELGFPDLRDPIVYVAKADAPRPNFGLGMGQHAQVGYNTDPARSFPSLAAAAENCALSRIWAGAHLRAADDEAQRMAGVFVSRAARSVPPLK